MALLAAVFFGFEHSIMQPMYAMEAPSAPVASTETVKAHIAELLKQVPVEKVKSYLTTAALIGACDAVSQAGCSMLGENCAITGLCAGVALNTLLLASIKLITSYKTGVINDTAFKVILPTELYTDSHFAKKPILASVLTITSLLNSFANDLGISPTAAYALFFATKIATFDHPLKDAIVYNLSSSISSIFSGSMFDFITKKFN